MNADKIKTGNMQRRTERWNLLPRNLLSFQPCAILSIPVLSFYFSIGVHRRSSASNPGC
jgi:hypothetical protein